MAGNYVVVAQWDDEAQVWVATSDDIPGLVTEAATLDALFARVSAVAPELLEANGRFMARPPRRGEAIDFHIVSTLHLDGTAAA